MFGVFTFTLMHVIAKTIFPEGMGVYKIVMEIPKGWGGYFSGQNMEIPRSRGSLREIPSVVGVWIFSGTTHYKKYYYYCYYYCYYYYFSFNFMPIYNTIAGPIPWA